MVDGLRNLLTEADWQTLPQLLDSREAFLREDRLRRNEEARLRPIRERERAERLKAEEENLKRQKIEEQEELQRSREMRRHRLQALQDRLSSLFLSDFLSADNAYRYDSDRELLSQADYEVMKAEFVKTWAQQKLDLDLDDQQAAAVAAVGANILVKARAGSGKTRTLVTRAIFLILHCRVDPGTILLLAFNKKAASEMRVRLKAALVNNIPHVMTFHALAHALVQPEEAIISDGTAPGTGAQSYVLQNIIDEHISSGELTSTIQRIMLEHFRADWEAIINDGVNLGMSEALARKRALPRETLGGNFVKSRGEKLIANILFEHGVGYDYEKSRRWNGVNYRPDFTVTHPGGGGIVIEYFGLKGDPDYDEDTQDKRAYWGTQSGWRLLEYTPSDIAEGDEAFTERLVADLAKCNLHVQRLSEEEIWKRVRGRAIDRFTGAVKTFVSRCRKRGLSDTQLSALIKAHVPLTSFEADFLQIGQTVQRAYIQKLAQTNTEDFDGLMWRAIQNLREGSTTFARDKAQEKGDLSQLRFLLIDEFQDFSPVFFEIISGIRAASAKVELFCVGDDWQAINSFTGSDPQYFTSFRILFENAATRLININYRSPAMVVAAGNAVMDARGLPAVAAREDEGDVRLCDLDALEPTAIERDRHHGDDITPAVLRLVQRYLKLKQNIVLLSRRNSIPWYVRYNNKRDQPQDALEKFLSHVRSYLPEKDHERVSISTTHKYKGLEQEAVILLDAIEGSYPLIHPSWIFVRVFGDTLETLEEEERRLFYVAVTRASKSLCLVTETRRVSPYLLDIEKQFNLATIPWETLPIPSLDQAQVEIIAFNVFDVKDKLKAIGFRWNSKRQSWSKSFPADEFSEEGLLAETWYCGKAEVEVRSNQGEVIRPRSRNSRRS